MTRVNSLRDLFNAADRNLNCNTAYPVYKREFIPFLKDTDLFENVHEFSLYIHVPFCRQFCSFCEYTKFLSGNLNDERLYLDALEAQTDEFLDLHQMDLLRGFDIGGGTPTALSDQSFGRLLQIQRAAEKRVRMSNDFEKSIECSFPTLTEEKIHMIGTAGFKRVSGGLQYVDKALEESMSRESDPAALIKEKISMLHKAGVDKVNLDIMYGMPGEREEALHNTLAAVIRIFPEQVTVYETRFNRTAMKHHGIDRERQYRQYCEIFEYLTAHGYKSRFGSNAFSMLEDDGVSSYIRGRMVDAVPYRGFGPSAQSMSDRGLSYETLKNTDQTRYPGDVDWTQRMIYELPPEEMAAKYVCIALYSGQFNIVTASRLLRDDFGKRYRDELDFLFSSGYAEFSGDYVRLTREGFRYYGAAAALFWSDRQKKKLLAESD